MHGRDQQGFTIIETSLFLAISSLLFVGLLGGISLAVQRQRYSDSVQSTLSFLQKQFNETLNVVNDRGDDPCAPSPPGEPIGASNCFVMGKEIRFYPGSGADSDRAEVRTVIGHDATGPNPSLQDYFDRVVDAGGQEFLVPWGAQVVAAAVRPGSGPLVPIDRILLLRSPESGATVVYAFPAGQNIEDLDATTYRVSEDRPAVVCLRSQDVANAFTELRFTGSGSQDGVVATFDRGPDCGL